MDIIQESYISSGQIRFFRKTLVTVGSSNLGICGVSFQVFLGLSKQKFDNKVGKEKWVK